MNKMAMLVSTIALFYILIPIKIFSQDCSNITVDSDPFTKEVSLYTPYNEYVKRVPGKYYPDKIRIRFRMVNNTYFIDIRYGKDIGRAIYRGNAANLPQMNNNTELSLLLSNDSVIKLQYTNGLKRATDPRRSENRLDVSSLGFFRMDPMDERGRVKDYYAYVTGEFQLSASQFTEINSNNITMIRFENREIQIDAELRNPNFIIDALECAE